MHIRRTLGIGLAVASMIALAACSNGTSDNSSNPTSSGSGNKGTINLSGQNFGEMQIMASMYQQILENAGYTVNVKLVTTRDVYVAQLDVGRRGHRAGLPGGDGRLPQHGGQRPERAVDLQ